MKVTRDKLDLVIMPEETPSYKPVSHLDLVDTIMSNANGCFDGSPVSEDYTLTRKGNQMFGVLNYRIGTNGTNLSVGFRNSYDKSLPVGIVSGAHVIVCSNLMFKGDIISIRRHTTNIWRDIEEIIKRALELSKVTYNSILEDKKAFQDKYLHNIEAAKLLGVLYAEEEILSPTQLSIAKREWYKDNINFPSSDMWKFYNACTESLKNAHPTEIMEKHTNLHQFLLEYNG